MLPLFTLAPIIAAAVLAQSPELGFTPASPGEFTFNTGSVKGLLTATADHQGVTSLVDLKTGRELAKGRDGLGIFSYYRFLGTDRRWGHAGWTAPKKPERTADGTVRIVWPAQPDEPFELTATYRWSKPDTLDVETAIQAKRDLPKFEVFLASYFADVCRCRVFLKPGRYASGSPALVPAEVTPLTQGLYYAFVRDLQAAQLVVDGRWLRGDNPVDWAITRYLAGALAVQEDRAGGLVCAVMSRPEDCFCVYASYNAEPPDGVAGHHSTYLGLFGKDIPAGQTVRTTSRLLVARGLSDEPITAAYRQFVAAR